MGREVSKRKSLPICHCDVADYKASNLGRVIVRYTGRRIIKALPLLKKIKWEKKKKKKTDGSLSVVYLFFVFLNYRAKFCILSVSNFAFGEGFSDLSNPTHKHLSLYPLRLKVLDFQL